MSKTDAEGTAPDVDSIETHESNRNQHNILARGWESMMDGFGSAIDVLKEGGQNNRRKLGDYFREYGFLYGLVRAVGAAVRNVLISPFVIVAAGLQTLGFNLGHGRDYERAVQAEEMRRRDREGRAYDREAERKPKERDEKTRETGQREKINPADPEKSPMTNKERAEKMKRMDENLGKFQFKRAVSRLPINHFAQRSNSFITIYDKASHTLCFTNPYQEQYQRLEKGEFRGLLDGVPNLHDGVACLKLDDFLGHDARKIMDIYNAFNKIGEPSNEKEANAINNLTLNRAATSILALRDMHKAIQEKDYPTDFIRAGKISVAFSPQKNKDGEPLLNTEKMTIKYDGKEVGTLSWLNREGKSVTSMGDANFRKTASAMVKMLNGYFKEHNISAVDLNLTKDETKKRVDDVMLKAQNPVEKNGKIYYKENPVVQRINKIAINRMQQNINEGMEKDPQKLLKDFQDVFKYDYRMVVDNESIRKAVKECSEKVKELEKNEQSHSESEPVRDSDVPQHTGGSKQPEHKPETKNPSGVNLDNALTRVDKEMLNEAFLEIFSRDQKNDSPRPATTFLDVYSGQYSANGKAAINAAMRMQERGELYDTLDDMMDDLFMDPDFIRDVQSNSEQGQDTQTLNDGFDTPEPPFPDDDGLSF